MLLSCEITLIENGSVFLCDVFNENQLNCGPLDRLLNMFKCIISVFLVGSICIIILSVLIFVFMENQYIAYNFYNGWRYVNFAKKLSDDQIVYILMLSVARDKQMLSSFNKGIKEFLNNNPSLHKSHEAVLGSNTEGMYKLLENLGNLNLFLYRDSKELKSNMIYNSTKSLICAYMRSLSSVDFSRILEYYYRSIGIACEWYNNNDGGCGNHSCVSQWCDDCGRNKNIYTLCDKLKESDYFNNNQKLEADDLMESLDKKYKLYEELEKAEYNDMTDDTRWFVFDFFEYILDEYNVKNPAGNTAVNKIDAMDIASIIAKIRAGKNPAQNPANNSNPLAAVSGILGAMGSMGKLVGTMVNNAVNNQNLPDDLKLIIDRIKKMQSATNFNDQLDTINEFLVTVKDKSTVIANHSQRDKKVNVFDTIDAFYSKLKFVNDLSKLSNASGFKELILDENNRDYVMDLLNVVSGYSSVGEDGKDNRFYVNLRKYNFDDKGLLNLSDLDVGKIYKSVISESKDTADMFDVKLSMKDLMNKMSDALCADKFKDDVKNFYLRLSLYENRKLLEIDIDPDVSNSDKEFVGSLIKVFALSGKLMELISSNKSGAPGGDSDFNKEIDKIFEENLFTSPIVYFFKNKLLNIIKKIIINIIKRFNPSMTGGTDILDDNSIAWKHGIFTFSDTMYSIIHFPLFFYDILFVIVLFIVPFIASSCYDFKKIALDSVKLMNKDLLSVKTNILTDLESNLSNFVYASYTTLALLCIFMIILIRSIMHYEVSGYGFGDLLSRAVPIAMCILLLIFDGNSLDYVQINDIMVDLSDKLRLVQEYSDALSDQVNKTIDKSEYNRLYIYFFILSLLISIITEYINFDKIDDFSFILDCELKNGVEYWGRFKKLSSVFLSNECPQELKGPKMYIYMCIFLILWTFIFVIIYMISRGFKRSGYYLLSSFEFFTSIIRSKKEIESLKMIDDFREVHLKVDKYVIFKVDYRKYDKAFFYKLNSLMLSADFDGMISHIKTLDDKKLKKELLKLAKNPDNILLQNVDFKIAAGNIVACVNGYQYTIPTDVCELRGISGSGKSTILKKLIGFQNTKYCMINDAIHNRLLHDKCRYLMPVFDVSSTYCVNYFTLGENFKIANVDYLEYTQRIFKDMNMEKYLDSFDMLLKNMFFSVGQRARIDLILWLLSVKNLPSGASCAIYADEPLASLDDKNSRAFLNIVMDIIREKKFVFLAVDHSDIVNEYASVLMQIEDKTVKYFVKDIRGNWRPLESLFVDDMQIEVNLGNKIIRRVRVEKHDIISPKIQKLKIVTNDEDNIDVIAQGDGKVEINVILANDDIEVNDIGAIVQDKPKVDDDGEDRIRRIVMLNDNPEEDQVKLSMVNDEAQQIEVLVESA